MRLLHIPLQQSLDYYDNILLFWFKPPLSHYLGLHQVFGVHTKGIPLEKKASTDFRDADDVLLTRKSHQSTSPDDSVFLIDKERE
jgi:hypothetical protein